MLVPLFCNVPGRQGTEHVPFWSGKERAWESKGRLRACLIGNRVVGWMQYHFPLIPMFHLLNPYCPDMRRDAPIVDTGRFPSPYEKITTTEEAILRSREWAREKLRVVMCCGCYDIPHHLHADGLQESANMGDKLIVLLGTDEHVKGRKDKGPVVPYAKRAMHLAHYPYVDLVAPMTGPGLGFAEQYMPSVITRSITSGPYVFKEIEDMRETLRSIGTEIVLMDEANAVLPKEFGPDRQSEFARMKFSSEVFSSTWIKKQILSSSPSRP